MKTGSSKPVRCAHVQAGKNTLTPRDFMWRGGMVNISGPGPLISRRATAIKWSVTQSMCQFDWKFCGSPAWCQAALTKSPSESS